MAIVKSPSLSVRRHSAAIGLSDRSGRRILHKDLNFHAYKIAIVPELSDRDMGNRRISSEQLLEMLNDDGVINTVLMIDEAHFHLSGYMNKQNYRYWAPENPQELHQHALHSERLTVWCGIASFAVLGPYVFEDNDYAATTVTSKRYVAMLRNFYEPELRTKKFTHKLYYHVLLLIELYFNNFNYFSNFRPLTCFSVMIPETV